MSEMGIVGRVKFSFRNPKMHICRLEFFFVRMMRWIHKLDVQTVFFALQLRYYVLMRLVNYASGW